MLSAKELIREPFAVINADDYYGKSAFVKIHDFLVSEARDHHFCMAGFLLKNTLSENGGVTRGICQVDTDGNLLDVVETSNIIKTADGASVDGVPVDPNAYVSMNMWGLTPEFMTVLEEGFLSFLENTAASNPLKAEYLLPIYIGQLLREGQASVKVLETNDKWFGVTYQEDKPQVVASFRELIETGVYREGLYGDL